MESKWQDGSLTYPVERSLVMLAIHLESSNYDEADKLQVNYEFCRMFKKIWCPQAPFRDLFY